VLQPLLLPFHSVGEALTVTVELRTLRGKLLALSAGLPQFVLQLLDKLSLRHAGVAALLPPIALPGASRGLPKEIRSQIT
jgi:hypothetical protein